MIGWKDASWRAGMAALILFHSAAVTPASGQQPATNIFMACGEPARRANGRMRAIVSAVDDVWSVRVRVYESVAPAPPHARPGGCIFYNPAYLNVLLRRLMVSDPSVVDPLLYAIMAHEVGHELHHDFSPARAN